MVTVWKYLLRVMYSKNDIWIKWFFHQLASSMYRVNITTSNINHKMLLYEGKPSQKAKKLNEKTEKRVKEWIRKKKGEKSLKTEEMIMKICKQIFGQKKVSPSE